MIERFDAIVIGTGFGGAVSACRLTQAGQKVAVLERGRRYPMHSFPRSFDTLKGWLWHEDHGIYDVKPINEMLVVQGAGYGGGSLVYASVHLRPDPHVFSKGWPSGYDRESLDPYYDLVAYMLDIKPITSRRGPLPPKTERMRRVAERLGRSQQFLYPNLAINLDTAGVVEKNKFGVPQSGCTDCGECDAGCNVHAKNTLDLNYLAVAERGGAHVRTRCEATSIAPLDGGYTVTFLDHGQRGAVERIWAKHVFLCAGAVNSTELLLRCRDEHRTLPRLSDRRGFGYSANGDFLAFVFDEAAPCDPWHGPTITSGIVYDRGEGDDKIWFILEEGGYPRELARLVELLGRVQLNPRCADATALRDAVTTHLRPTAHLGAAAWSQPARGATVLLAMGRDRADGRISLVPCDGKLCVKWNVRSNLHLYSTEAQLCSDIARELGGRFVPTPLWRALHQPVAVHNLGGCGMSERAEDGVTDPEGQVHGYPNLYVLDGAILPGATGVNPSSTIAAVAERNIERIIRRITGNAAWGAPEREKAVPVREPLSLVVIPAGGTALPETPGLSLQFTETMKGFLTQDFIAPDDYRGGEEAGRRGRTAAEFTLTITIQDLDRFLADNAHAGAAQGVVRIAGFTTPEGAPVDNGVFNLFVRGSSGKERQMLYALRFIGADGKEYLLDGYKTIMDHPGIDVWEDTTALFTVIREGTTRTAPVVATGILRIALRDFLEQLTTFSVAGTDKPAKKLEALGRFGRMFLGELWEVYVRDKLPACWCA